VAQYCRAAAIEPTGRSVLHTPLSRGMTVMSGREAGYMRERVVGLIENRSHLPTPRCGSVATDAFIPLIRPAPVAVNCRN
jgi:hypothetical protein